jgi:hypothetical protein
MAKRKKRGTVRDKQNVEISRIPEEKALNGHYIWSHQTPCAGRETVVVILILYLSP